MIHLLAQIGPPALPPPPATPNITDPSDAAAIFQVLSGQWAGAVMPYAYEIFGVLAALELAVFCAINIPLMYRGGDIRDVISSVANKVLVIGMFLALLENGTTWMAYIISSFIQIGKDASGVPSLAPSMILLQGFKVFGVMFGAALVHGSWLDLPTAMALLVAGVFICGGFLFITIQFVITQVQVFLALGIGVLFLGFGASRWTASYVERYFAFAFGAGIKLMTLYLLVGGGWQMTNKWVTAAPLVSLTSSGVEQAWAIACGAVMYAAICWFAPSQISAMLGGSPNLSHSDLSAFMAPMISAAVAGGMAAAGIGAGAAKAAAGAAAGGKGAAGPSTGASTPAGAPAPQASAGGKAMAAAAGMAQAGAGAMSRMPSASGHAPPPHFSGFGH